MDEVKLRGLMGLCARARQATFGEDGCMKAIRSGQCGVVLLDGSASESTTQKYRSACSHYGVMLGEIPPNLLCEATGRPGVAMAVASGGLAEQIRHILKIDEAGNQQMKPGNNCGGASVE